MRKPASVTTDLVTTRRPGIAATESSSRSPWRFLWIRIRRRPSSVSRDSRVIGASNKPAPGGEARMLDLGLALFLALIAAGFGKRLLDSAGELPDHPIDALALATPLGLGLLALGCLGLGEAGWL